MRSSHWQVLSGSRDRDEYVIARVYKQERDKCLLVLEFDHSTAQHNTSEYY